MRNSLFRLVPVLGLLLLVSLPDQAQFGGGIGFPGSGGIGFPGSGGGIGRRRQQQNQMPTDNFLGVLQQISSTSLTMITDDKLTVTVMLNNSTRYVKENGNNGKNIDFSVGDRISVDSNQDNNGNNRGIKVTQVRVGNADDKAQAQQSSRSNTNSSIDDDDPDRPRLHRADGSGNVSSNDPPPSSSNSNSSSSSSSSASARPSSQPVYNNDDDAPPVLRRGRPQQTASASIPDDSSSSGARPSIHAEEVNGVTQAPPPPRVDNSAGPNTDGRGFTSLPRDSGDQTIDKAREEVFAFSETLPNYVVKQYTTRYETNTASAKTSWSAIDAVTADVIEENGVERYKNILVNGKAPRDAPEKTGSWSSGEFSSLLQDVFATNTNAEFHGKRSTTINNRTAFRYDFSVEQPNSHWHVETGGQSYLPAYSGTVWIDKETLRVLRVEMAAQNMPRSFPLDTVESAVDYDFVLIGDGKFLLPTHSEALSCERNSRACSRNVIDFRNYRKFSAESSITFEPDRE